MTPISLMILYKLTVMLVVSVVTKPIGSKKIPAHWVILSLSWPILSHDASSSGRCLTISIHSSTPLMMWLISIERKSSMMLATSEAILSEALRHFSSYGSSLAPKRLLTIPATKSSAPLIGTATSASMKPAAVEA